MPLEVLTAERRRDEIARDIQAARREHQRQQTPRTTPDELMSELLPSS